MANINPVGSNSGAAAFGYKPATGTPTNQINKETFMQLLVSQIKHQNPLNPSDGVQFLSQLAQFSELEQLINVSGELKQIRESVGELAKPDTEAA